jgi:hypothetical protein
MQPHCYALTKTSASRARRPLKCGTDVNEVYQAKQEKTGGVRGWRSLLSSNPGPPGIEICMFGIPGSRAFVIRRENKAGGNILSWLFHFFIGPLRDNLGTPLRATRGGPGQEKEEETMRARVG